MHMTTKNYGKYLKTHGRHFTKELCDFAVSMMEDDKGSITPITKEELDDKLRATGIKLQYNELYDYVYVANMCKADFLGEAVPNDDVHLCKYVKGVIDDPDGYDGQVFDRWISDMEGMRFPIEWSEFI